MSNIKRMTDPPIDQPYPGAAFADAWKRFWVKGVTFSGRASRSEYWKVALFNIVVFFAYYLLVFLARDVGGLVIVLTLLFWVFALAMVVPGIAVTFRRLHDANLAGPMFLLGLVPFVGGLIVAILAAQPSNPQGARFDAMPVGWNGQPSYPTVGTPIPSGVPQSAPLPYPPAPPAGGVPQGFGYPPVPAAPPMAESAPAIPYPPAPPIPGAQVSNQPPISRPVSSLAPPPPPPPPPLPAASAPVASMAPLSYPPAPPPAPGVGAAAEPPGAFAPIDSVPLAADATRASLSPALEDEHDGETRIASGIAPVSAWRLSLPDGSTHAVVRSAILGRDPAARPTHPGAELVTVVDAFKSVSKSHAVLEVREGTVWVTDLGSTNGTAIDGAPITARVATALRAGSELRLGDCVIGVDRLS